MLATATEHPNVLPIIANNPQAVGVIVILALLVFIASEKARKFVLIAVPALFVAAVIVSAVATRGQP